ncbi:MAG: DUF1223 domain-containing protein [Deltaproteobacteria bacterium]|nr:DUF1223 domain-containing protein [Deltaproteobacteria bacterium]
MMKQKRPPTWSKAILGLAAMLAIGVAIWPFTSSHSEENSDSRAPSFPEAPVVVELFTSQGCSSCPAADRILSQLGRASSKSPGPGTRTGSGTVIPLSYHVDYWNYIGWQDPFSQARWSQRQERYAKALESRRLYTPQAIVQGQEDCVGSRSTCVLEAIARARKVRPKARLEGHLRKTASPTRLSLDLQGVLNEELSSTQLEAVAIVFETGLRTEIDSGENARRTLENDFVVRSLSPVFTLAEAGAEVGTESRPATAEGSVTLHIDPSWDRRELGVAALLQDSETLEIHASWSVRGIPQ